MLLSFSYFGAILGIAVSSDVMTTTAPIIADYKKSSQHLRHKHDKSVEKHDTTNYFINQLTTPAGEQLPGGSAVTGYWPPQVRPQLPSPPIHTLYVPTQRTMCIPTQRTITSSPDISSPTNDVFLPHIHPIPQVVTPASIMRGQVESLVPEDMLVAERDIARERTRDIIADITQRRAQSPYS